jgi:hypothetical protein
VSVLLLLDLPGRDEAREAAQRELSKHAYQEAQPPWFERLIRWVLGKLQDVFAKASGNVPGGGWGLFFLVLIIGLLIAVVLVKLRPARRTSGLPELFADGRELTADAHRRLAEQAAARGEWAEAVRERLRAVVRELEARGVVEPRPGRTADEVAAEAGRVVPSLSGALLTGARLFDEIWYGGREADAASYRVLVDLDERVGNPGLVLA